MREESAATGVAMERERCSAVADRLSLRCEDGPDGAGARRAAVASLLEWNAADVQLAMPGRMLRMQTEACHHAWSDEAS